MFSRKIKKQLFTRRALILGGIKAGLLGALTARLYYLQIVKESQYKTFSDSNRIRLSLLTPLRGKILDKDGRPLAINRNYYRVLYDPQVKIDLGKVIPLLARLLELSKEETFALWKKIRKHNSRRPLMLYEHLTWRQVSRVEVNMPDLPGMSIDVGRIRYFPMGEQSPHVIGYLGPVSESEIKRNPLLNHPDFKVGISGIEESFDGLLRGKAGVKRMEVNAYGLAVSELSRDESKPGDDLYLTLDKRLQTYTSERLSQTSGSAVVMDVMSGNILAIASTPGFDPNQFTYGLSSEQWRKLVDHHEHPLINKALSNQYPPGSTFKMSVALAALKDEVDPTKTIYCPGYVTLGRRRFHCWKKQGHGHMNMENAIMHSCNAYFYTIAKRIGIDNIQEMAKKLGLGQRFDIGIAEQKSGLVPGKKWKKERFNQSWQAGDTLNVGIGQGDMLVTPLQLAVMVSRISTGRLVVPHLHYTPQAGPVGPVTVDQFLDIDSEHLDIVREGMRRVINVPGGTAYGSRISKWQFQMAGKTGTSQVISKELSDEELAKLTPQERKKLDNHALFVGFAPVHDPRFAVSVVVEHGKSGSKAAAPVGRDLLHKAQTLGI